MPRPLAHSIIGVVVAMLLLIGLGAGTAAGSKQSGVPYRGMTDQDREIKLIVDGRGRVFVSGAEWPAEIDGAGPAVGESVIVDGLTGSGLKVRAI